MKSLLMVFIVLFLTAPYAQANDENEGKLISYLARCESFIRDEAAKAQPPIVDEGAESDKQQKMDKVNDRRLGQLTTNRDKLKYCNNLDLSKDITVQILIMLTGADGVRALELLSTSFSALFNKEQATYLAVQFEPLHRVMRTIGLFFFSVFVFCFLLQALIQLLKWQNGDFDVTLFRYLSRKMGASFFHVFLLYPVGTLSVIQFLFVFGLFSVIYATKPLINSFFASNIQEMFYQDVESKLKLDFTETVNANINMYRCDIERTESLIEQVRNIKGDVALTSFGDPFVSCLRDRYNSTVWDSVQKKYPSNARRTINSGKENIYIFQQNIIPKRINYTQFCYDNFSKKEEYKEITELPDCGKINITVPTEDAYFGLAESNIEKLKSIFLNTKFQQDLSKIALLKHQEDCQKDIVIGSKKQFGSNVNVKCLEPRHDLMYGRFEVAEDVVTKEKRFKFIAKPYTPEEKQRLDDKIHALRVNVKDYLGANTRKIYQNIGELFQSGEAIKNKLINQKDVEKVRVMMERGQWLVSTLFLSNTTEGLDLKAVKQHIQRVYQFTEGYNGFGQSVSGSLSEIGDGFSEAFDEIDKYIRPRHGVYQSHMQCWREVSQCEITPLNPYIYLNRKGADHISHAMYPYLVTMLISKYKPFGISLTVITILENLYFIQFLLGFILAVAIPVIPLLYMMSALISWSQDFVKYILSMLVNLAISPLDEQGDKFFSDEIRKVFAGLITLAVHLVFILIGIVCCFLMTSFFFSLNVILIGVFSDQVGMGQTSGALNSAVMSNVYDAAVVLIIAMEVKFCATFIKKIPEALAMHFNMEVSHDAGFAEEVVNKIKGQVFPEIAKLLGR
ncbi:MAG: hypothetical protein HAW67_02510 [Endozoicomonadaceae bacterium]|nr:hypothetical protein [Endozoicomonadaceae bacterium]